MLKWKILYLLLGRITEQLSAICDLLDGKKEKYRERVKGINEMDSKINNEMIKLQDNNGN